MALVEQFEKRRVADAREGRSTRVVQVLVSLYLDSYLCVERKARIVTQISFTSSLAEKKGELNVNFPFLFLRKLTGYCTPKELYYAQIQLMNRCENGAFPSSQIEAKEMGMNERPVPI